MGTQSTVRTATPPKAAPPAPPRGLAALGHWLARRRLVVLLITLAALVVAVPFGSDVESRLSEGGITAPASESARADALLNTRFGGGSPHLVLVTSAGAGVDDPKIADEATALTDRLSRERGVVQAASYWTLDKPATLRSKDGRTGLIMVRLSGDEDEIRKTAARIVPEVVGDQGSLKVTATGVTAVRMEIERISEEDLNKAELLSGPLVLIILLLVFGSVVAASMPLAVGIFAVIGSFVILRILDMFVQVSVFAVNITTALGLGLAIDYSLFIVTRYREELARGRTVHEAVGESVRTAGRTVLFSALTVAVSLSAMLVFPMYHLRSFAYSGIAVVILAALGSVVVLPALLAVLGHRIDSLNIRRLFRRNAKAAAATSDTEGFWHKLATAVMRRPVPFALAVAAVLVALGLPFMRATFGDSDDRVLPASSPAYQGAQVLREQFDNRESSPLNVVLPDIDATAAASSGKVADYAKQLSTVPGITRVDTLTGSYSEGTQVAPPGPASDRFKGDRGTWLSVVSDTEPYSDRGMDLVKTLRAQPAPDHVLVGGQAALLVDSKDTIGEDLPWALGIIALSTIVLLFLFTGSLLIPLKAIVLNLLSLTATFGAMVYIFQDGNLKWLVGDFSVTGMLDIDTPILMFCVAFGLSMDYEVFLLSRIKEEYHRTGDNISAVSWGLERTGRLVTAAAALVATVLLAFATSSLLPIKLLGIGLALAVIVDATLVRGVLVPAFMRLAGRANWWAPRPLARLHEKIGLKD